MGQVSLYRFKSTPLGKKILAPLDRKILDPCPSVDMVPPHRFFVSKYFFRGKMSIFDRKLDQNPFFDTIFLFLLTPIINLNQKSCKN